MKLNGGPIRRCCSCGSFKPKNEFIRIVRLPKSNEILVDRSGKVDGRGLYICKNEKCIKVAIKSKRIERNLKCKLSEKICRELGVNE